MNLLGERLAADRSRTQSAAGVNAGRSERNIPEIRRLLQINECARMIGQGLGICEMDVRIRTLRVNKLKQRGAATLVGIETGFQNALRILQQTSPIKLETLYGSQIFRIGITDIHFNAELRAAKLDFRLRSCRVRSFHLALIFPTGKREIDGNARAKCIVGRLSKSAGTSGSVGVRTVD